MAQFDWLPKYVSLQQNKHSKVSDCVVQFLTKGILMGFFITQDKQTNKKRKANKNHKQRRRGNMEKARTNHLFSVKKALFLLNF